MPFPLPCTVLTALYSFNQASIFHHFQNLSGLGGLTGKESHYIAACNHILNARTCDYCLHLGFSSDRQFSGICHLIQFIDKRVLSLNRRVFPLNRRASINCSLKDALITVVLRMNVLLLKIGSGRPMSSSSRHIRSTPSPNSLT